MPDKYSYSGNDFYSINRKEYYERLVLPKDISFFNQIFLSETTALPTNFPIAFRELKFGDNPKTVSRKLKLPRYIIENHDISSQIYFYKETINHHKVIMQLHFHDEEFFCACYTFRHESNGEQMRIKKMLFEKYTNLNGSTFEKCNTLIDTHGNVIFIYDNITLNIFYLWGNEKIKNAVSDSISTRHLLEATKKIKSEKELFSKL